VENLDDLHAAGMVQMQQIHSETRKSRFELLLSLTATKLGNGGLMKLIKSAAVGLLLLCGVAIVSPFLAFLFAYSFGFWKWDPIAFVRSPLMWVIVMVIFATGFVWEYRRQ
jgi:hypothetical protein